MKKHASEKVVLAISISKDTGLRPIEVVNLTLKDIDLDNNTVYPSTAKHGSARVLKIKGTTLGLLLKYLAKHTIGLNDKILGNWDSSTYGKWFRKYRNKLAEKLQDYTFKTIRLYDLRHFFATKLYHQTKDILYVKQQLGHRRISTTLIYTQLINFNDDGYTSAIAKNVEEARKLIEDGFEYVTEIDNVKLFRKRK